MTLSKVVIVFAISPSNLFVDVRLRIIIICSFFFFFFFELAVALGLKYWTQELLGNVGNRLIIVMNAVVCA